MVTEYLVSTSFCEVINTRLSQNEYFNDFTGQVYFMIILDACKNSDIIYIEVIENNFNNVSLNDFTGENISYIYTNA